MDNFVWCLLTHQPAVKVRKMIDHWSSLFSGEVVIIYGGPKEEYAKIEHPLKALVEDPKLKTCDHPRERQSYTEVFRAAAEVIKGLEAKYVYFTEYDQVPFDVCFLEDLLEQMQTTNADLLCSVLKRVDGTNHPHYLNHQYDGGLQKQVGVISVRHNKKLILTCLGFGQCWRRSVFLEVASVKSISEVYLELWIPTIAHHLGYKVRSMCMDPQWNTHDGLIDREQLDKCDKKPFIVHPLKDYW